jgi:uncharacterized protein (UPF0128 family)
MTRSVNRWTVDIFLGEEDGRTYAEARLITDAGDKLVGAGHAQVGPRDYNVPEIGDEVAVARALRALGDKLLLTASGDIESTTGQPTALAH